MPDREALKAELRRTIGESQPDGTYDGATLDRVHALIEDVVAVTPMPRPVDHQDRVAGPWKTLFAQFGPRHTAGKPIVHESSFKLLSFAKMPDKPLRLIELEQEIHHESKDYNNVQVIESPKDGTRANLIIYGRYAIPDDHPQRYGVEFYRVTLESEEGLGDDALREAFDLDADQPLTVDFKPPRLHSDIVYCDDDMRINYGSVGGIYVLERLAHSGRSVSFA